MQKYLVELFSGTKKVHELHVYAQDKAGALIVLSRQHKHILNATRNLSAKVQVL